MRILFLILGVMGIAFTLLKLIRYHHWTIRFFDFPQLQFLLFNLASTAGLIAFFTHTNILDWLVLLVVAGCTVYEFYIIWPYTIMAPVQTPRTQKQKKKADIGIMISNVYQLNEQYDRLLTIRKRVNPDILITLESNHDWDNHLNSLDEEYPYHVKIPLENMYGMHLFSRLRLTETQVKYRVEDDIPSIETMVEMNNGEKVKMFCLHPKPPSPTENEESTERDAELLLVAKEIQNYSQPVIVAGDLNDVAWSHSTRLFQRISGLLDPRKGRGFFNTFNANLWFFRWPLDHIFHSEHFGLVEIMRLPNVGSDHFPIFASFNYEPTIEVEEEPEEADREDEEEAVETINSALDK